MTFSPSHGIGDRLARLRKKNGQSAQQLSDATGGLVTRSVIANIESGRRVDVTVDQLFILANALGVTPVALALPIDKPRAEVTLAPNVTRTVTELLSAVTIDAHYRAKLRVPSEANVWALDVIRRIYDYDVARLLASTHDPDLEKPNMKLDEMERDLAALGVEIPARNR